MPKRTMPAQQTADADQISASQPTDGGPPSIAVDRERIAQRAYERFEQRGGEPGRDQEDWFEAEREVNQSE